MLDMEARFEGSELGNTLTCYHTPQSFLSILQKGEPFAVAEAVQALHNGLQYMEKKSREVLMPNAPQPSRCVNEQGDTCSFARSVQMSTVPLVPLCPDTLRCLLGLLCRDGVSDADEHRRIWSEVRKKVSFVFLLLDRCGLHDLLADALVYGRAQITATEEATQCNFSFPSSDSDADVTAGTEERNLLSGSSSNDYSPLVVPWAAAEDHLHTLSVHAGSSMNTRGLSHLIDLLVQLVDAHGNVNLCATAAPVFRALGGILSIAQLLLSDVEVPVMPVLGGSFGTTEEVAPPTTSPTSTRFDSTLVGRLCRYTQVSSAICCAEAWNSFQTLLVSNPSLGNALFQRHRAALLPLLVNSLNGPHVIARHSALHLTSMIFSDTHFLRARSFYASSPALLCAFLAVVQIPTLHPSYHHHVCVGLGECIQYPHKPLAMRHLLTINRDGLLNYLQHIAVPARAVPLLNVEAWCRILRSLEPLTEEEMFALGLGV